MGKNVKKKDSRIQIVKDLKHHITKNFRSTWLERWPSYTCGTKPVWLSVPASEIRNVMYNFR